MDEIFDQSWNTDDLRIDVNTPYVLAYWANQFGITPDDLRVTVARSGPVLRNVKRELENAVLARKRFARARSDADRQHLGAIAAAGS